MSTPTFSFNDSFDDVVRTHQVRCTCGTYNPRPYTTKEGEVKIPIHHPDGHKAGCDVTTLAHWWKKVGQEANERYFPPKLPDVEA